MDNRSNSIAASRIVGLDLARSLAMLGMMVVHFSLVGSADHTHPQWLACLLKLLDGRASATFMILSGIGLTLLTRNIARSSESESGKMRRTVICRGVFLLAIGFLNLMIWPGDILRIYGVSLIVAAFLFRAADRVLLSLAASFCVAFAVLVAVADFEQNWNWSKLEYRNLWTPAGLLRNLFFDGFRSVLPWTGFVLFGMWLGRLDLTDRKINNRALVWGGSIALATEALSHLLVTHFQTHPNEALDTQTMQALFGTESMPALPLFLLAAGGAGIAVIALCVRLTVRSGNHLVDPLVATGQMALTWYVLHILVGLGSLVALGLVGKLSFVTAASCGLIFFVVAVMTSWIWKQSMRQGPIEWLMRKIAG